MIHSTYTKKKLLHTIVNISIVPVSISKTDFNTVIIAITAIIQSLMLKFAFCFTSAANSIPVKKIGIL